MLPFGFHGWKPSLHSVLLLLLFCAPIAGLWCKSGNSETDCTNDCAFILSFEKGRWKRPNINPIGCADAPSTPPSCDDDKNKPDEPKPRYTCYCSSGHRCNNEGADALEKEVTAKLSSHGEQPPICNVPKGQCPFLNQSCAYTLTFGSGKWATPTLNATGCVTHVMNHAKPCDATPITNGDKPIYQCFCNTTDCEKKVTSTAVVEAIKSLNFGEKPPTVAKSKVLIYVFIAVGVVLGVAALIGVFFFIRSRKAKQEAERLEAERKVAEEDILAKINGQIINGINTKAASDVLAASDPASFSPDAVTSQWEKLDAEQPPEKLSFTVNNGVVHILGDVPICLRHPTGLATATRVAPIDAKVPALHANHILEHKDLVAVQCPKIGIGLAAFYENVTDAKPDIVVQLNKKSVEEEDCMYIPEPGPPQRGMAAAEWEKKQGSLAQMPAAEVGSGKGPKPIVKSDALIKVTVGECTGSFYQTRDILVQKTLNGRTLKEHRFKHKHYTRWTDHQIPSEWTDLMALIGDLHSELSKGKKIWIHCKAGIGRTGVVCTILMVLEELKKPGAVLSLELINKCFLLVRHSRHSAVQGAGQYYVTIVVPLLMYMNAAKESKSKSADKFGAAKDFLQDLMERVGKEYYMKIFSARQDYLAEKEMQQKKEAGGKTLTAAEKAKLSRLFEALKKLDYSAEE